MWVFDFFPVADGEPVTYSVAGDVLTVNGEAFDLWPLGEGESLPATAIPGSAVWLRSTEITRWEGALRLCVAMPFDSAVPWPAHVRHPDAVTVETDGPVPLPTDWTAPEPADEIEEDAA
jgi:hypothetical protein